MGLRSPGSGAGYAPPLSAHDARMDETLGWVEGRGSWPTTEQQVGRQQEGNGYGRHRDFPSGADVLPLLCCFRSDSSPEREVLTFSSACLTWWRLRASTALCVNCTVRRLFFVFGSPRARLSRLLMRELPEMRVLPRD